MQISRLFEMVYLLLDKKSLTAAELAAHFEVSKRTILRDVDALATAGISVYTTQGKGGGISILESYILNKAILSKEEQNQILFALQGMSVAQDNRTKSVLEKLSGLFEASDTGWIEVDFSRWGKRETDTATFEMLKTAIINNQALVFQYSSSYGETMDRTVYPLKLVFKSKEWYLRAYCLTREDYRTFKIVRMQNVKLLGESFAHKIFECPDIAAEDQRPPSLLEVKLYFSARAAYRAYDEFDEKSMEFHTDGSLTVTCTLPHDGWLYGYLLSFGDEIEVVEPRYVREELAKQAERIQLKYKDRT